MCLCVCRLVDEWIRWRGGGGGSVEGLGGMWCVCVGVCVCIFVCVWIRGGD